MRMHDGRKNVYNDDETCCHCSCEEHIASHLDIILIWLASSWNHTYRRFFWSHFCSCGCAHCESVGKLIIRISGRKSGVVNTIPSLVMVDAYTPVRTGRSKGRNRFPLLPRGALTNPRNHAWQRVTCHFIHLFRDISER